MSDHVYQVYGEAIPLTFRTDMGDHINLTDAVQVVEYVDERPPRPARVIDLELGKVEFPDDLELGEHRLYYEVYWSNDMIERIPSSVPARVTIKPPDVEVDE